MCSRCERTEIKSRGLCGRCYWRATRDGNLPLLQRRKKEPKPCSACGDIPAVAKGLCDCCYQRAAYQERKKRQAIEFPWQELFRLRSDAVDHADRVHGLVEFIKREHCLPCLKAVGRSLHNDRCYGCDIWELTKEAKP